MSVLNNKQTGHNNNESNDSLSPGKVSLVIISIICIFIATFLARSFLFGDGIIILGLILTVVGSFALTQDR
ncbi:MAG: hypothetical protein GY943_19870 [Chloroflexi bacterium]|nr:hypothetical protein [Chloroflexota bacterium]